MLFLIYGGGGVQTRAEGIEGIEAVVNYLVDLLTRS